jgi:cobalamin biosynthesis protein CbiD
MNRANSSGGTGIEYAEHHGRNVHPNQNVLKSMKKARIEKRTERMALRDNRSSIEHETQSGEAGASRTVSTKSWETTASLTQ